MTVGTLPHVHRRAKGTFRYDPKRKPVRHVIENIRFVPGVPSELAPITCSCGTWSGPASQFQRHRTDHGERLAWESGGGRDVA